MANFDLKCDGSRKSVDAEIWFRDRFWGDTKTLCGDFGNFDFSRVFRGSKFKFVIF